MKKFLIIVNMLIIMMMGFVLGIFSTIHNIKLVDMTTNDEVITIGIEVNGQIYDYEITTNN